MIILASVCGTLEEYLLAGGQPHVDPPASCARCFATAPFRRHSGYWRTAIEGKVTADIRVSRFRCRICNLVVSVLFGFLLPYRRFSVRAVAAAIEGYATQNLTYREQAEEVSGLAGDGQESTDSSERTRPAVSQVFRWVKIVCNKTEWLLLQVQKELVLSGKFVDITGKCPRAPHAKSEQKKFALNRLATVFAFGSQLLAASDKIASALHAYFLAFAETKCAFLIGIAQQLRMQQSLQKVIF